MISDDIHREMKPMIIQKTDLSVVRFVNPLKSFQYRILSSFLRQWLVWAAFTDKAAGEAYGLFGFMIYSL